MLLILCFKVVVVVVILYEKKHVILYIMPYKIQPLEYRKTVVNSTALHPTFPSGSGHMLHWFCLRATVISMAWYKIPGGSTPKKIGWECAARFPKRLPYLWPKSAIFHFLFVIWPKIRNPIYDQNFWKAMIPFKAAHTYIREYPLPPPLPSKNYMQLCNLCYTI